MPNSVQLAASLGVPDINSWDQGDIVDGVYFAAFDKKMPGVLVTPACDIAQEKVDLWTFVGLFPDIDVAKASVAKELEEWNLPPGTPPSRKQRSSLAKALGFLIAQRLPRYHWIPVTIGEVTGHVADFTCVTALPAAEVKGGAKRVATLLSSWREQVPARYAAFMARVGTVDFDDATVNAEIERLVSGVLATWGAK